MCVCARACVRVRVCVCVCVCVYLSVCISGRSSALQLNSNLLPDLAKGALLTHDVKTQIFSSTFKSYINTLTVHVCVIANS